MGNLEKLWECFSLKNTPDASPEAPDAGPVHPVCCLLLAELGLSTGRHAPNAGLTLFVRAVWPVLSGRL